MGDFKAFKRPPIMVKSIQRFIQLPFILNPTILVVEDSLNLLLDMLNQFSLHTIEEVTRYNPRLGSNLL